LLRGTEQFTNNTVVSGRTVNVVSGSPVVTGNNFGDVRLKVYNEATAQIANNTINNLVFDNTTVPQNSTFTNNTLSDSAQAALNAMNFVAKIGSTYYTSIAAAIAAAQNGDTVVISAGEYAPINISNKNITLQGTVGDNGELLTVIKGGNPAITGHGFNGTIKDIKVVDAFKVMYAEPAGNVTVDNIYVTGATYGLNLVACSIGLTWTIQNSYMDLAWANSFGVYGGDAAIVIRGNEFASTNPYYPDYGALPVNTFLPNITVEENIFGENTKIKLAAAFTDTSRINISKNYHADGVENAFADDPSVKVFIDQCYTGIDADGNLTGLVDCIAQIAGTAYTSLESAFAAAKDGDEVKILIAGTYALATSGKNITITGAVDGVVFDNIGEHNMGGASMTFNNVTFNYAMNSMYKGLQHSGNLVYNNCTINGQVFLYGDSETFNNCVFNQEDPNNYNVWTYSADPVAFKNCTFNCEGKSVLIYHENASVQNNVTVTDCDFIAYNAVDGKAAIEMDSSLTAGITLTIDADTTATGFGTGNVSGNSLWNNKKGQTTTANNDITVVVGGETVLQPITLTKLYIRMVDGEPRLGADVAPLKLEAKVNLDDPSWVEIDCNVTDNGERVGGFYWVTPKDNTYRFFKLAE
jgi:hypothetical protein